MELDADGIQIISCRVPTDLLTQITALAEAHPEYPSRGQVLAWTCEAHRDAVVEQVMDNVRAKRAERSARRGRGRGGGGGGRRVPTPTTPVTPHLWPEELAVIDSTHAAAAAAVATDPDLAGTTVTRTAVVVAAFDVASRTLPDTTSPQPLQ